MDKRFRAEIESVLSRSPLPWDLKHAKLTLKWVKKLVPPVNEAIRIAALCHDIERAVDGKKERGLKDISALAIFKGMHAKRSAEITAGLMVKHGYPKSMADEVSRLISLHESGGDRESDMLCSADSLAFFEYNVPLYLARYGEERTREKIRFMYGRLGAKARALCRKMEFADGKIAVLFSRSIAGI